MTENASATPATESSDRDDWILRELKRSEGKISNRELQQRYKAAHDGVGVSNNVLARLRENGGYPAVRTGGWPKGRPRGKKPKGPKARAVASPTDVDLSRIPVEELLAELKRREREARALIAHLDRKKE